MTSKPSAGSMVYWRFLRTVPCAWTFGYVTYERGPDLIRLGSYNGDTTHGAIVGASEIEWQPYKR
jgi:hypothetical protein